MLTLRLSAISVNTSKQVTKKTRHNDITRIHHKITLAVSLELKSFGFGRIEHQKVTKE